MRVLAMSLSILFLVGCSRSGQKTVPCTPLHAGDISTYHATGVYEDYQADGIHMVRLEDGKLIALNAKSTHLGCLTQWIPQEQRFRNSCNGSLYDIEGINVAGPDPRPLERYKVTLVGQQVIVDKSVTFRQELGEWGESGAYLSMDFR